MTETAQKLINKLKNDKTHQKWQNLQKRTKMLLNLYRNAQKIPKTTHKNKKNGKNYKKMQKIRELQKFEQNTQKLSLIHI